jgi:hypothetical protein
VPLTIENRVDELLREKLKGQGVLDQIEKIQLFATPEGILAEVVLLDASVLEEARKAVQDVERKLESEGISLLPTVRALWQVEEVQRIEIPSPPGAPSDLVGALFKGILKSGTRHQEVWVAATPSAQQVLRPLATSDQALIALVRAYLRHRLSVGGVGYWDPIREQKLKLEESGAQYLRWRPYEQLRRSVDLVFRSIDKVRDFLQSFEGKRARDFNDVLEKLPGPGGAFARGERLPTSNYELFEMLLAPEKGEFSQYYRQKLEKAFKDRPELKQEFSEVLPESTT